MSGSQGTTIDLVPFGELQVDQQTLLWPPEMNVMTVAGFEEALRAAVEVELAANLTVKVASLARCQLRRRPPI